MTVLGLTAAGLLAGAAGVVVEDGEVVDQDPSGNDEAPRGSEVTLFVSKGPAPREVPDVVGRTKTVPLDYDLLRTARAVGVCHDA